MKPRVEIVIDELILLGFSPSERFAIGDSLSHELERLVMEQGFQPDENVHIPLLRAAPVKLPANAKPAVIGTQVAQAVYGGLER